MVTRASLMTTIIKAVSQAREAKGTTSTYLKEYRTNKNLSVSCIPHAPSYKKGSCLAINPVFIQPSETPVAHRLWPAQPRADCWAHSCWLSSCFLPRSFPPLFFDTSLEFSCPSKPTSNSHLRKEAREKGRSRGRD